MYTETPMALVCRSDQETGVGFVANSVADAESGIKGGRVSSVRHILKSPVGFLCLLLVIFLFKGILITLIFPPYSGHDEVTHYAYLKILAEEGRVPIIPDLDEWRAAYDSGGDWQSFDQIPDALYKYADNMPDAEYPTDYVTADWFGGEPNPVRAISFGDVHYPSGWIYTGNHPPLFYLLMVPVFKAVQGLDIDTQIYFFRLATIPFGMVTVLLAYLTTRTIFPRDRFLAMTVPAFVAFQPQIAYESAMLNNDILAIMFTSAVIWMIAVGLRKRFPLWNCLWMGLLLGLAIISKSTAVAVIPLIAFAMVIGLGWRSIREWLPKGLLTAGVAALVGLPWFIFMITTYGDPTALNRVSALQGWWNYGGGEGRSIWSMLSDKTFFWERWDETWGAFGWRLIQLDTNSSTLLQVLLWITLIATVGLAIYAIRFLRLQRWMTAEEERGRDPGEIRLHADETLALNPWQVTAVLTMGAACVIGYYSILQFGTTFSLTQARYFFPMIVPGALLFMLGVRSWFPRRWLSWVGAATFLGLVLLNLIIYTAYVIPYWNPNL